MIIALAAAAFAQDGTDGHLLELGAFGAPDAPFWRSWTPVAQRRGEMSAAAAFEYAGNVLGGPGGADVPGLMALDWRVDYAPLPALHVAVAGPLFLATDDRLGGEGYSSPALGDVRLRAGARASMGESALGVEGGMVLPTGPEGRLLGSEGLAWRARGVGHLAAGGFHGLASAGVDAESDTLNPKVRGGLYVAGNAGVAYAIEPKGLDALQFSAELTGRYALRSTAVGESPLELTVGGRGRVGDNTFGLAFAKDLGPGQPTADWRVLLAYGRKLDTLKDTDDDGIFDVKDACRDVPEVKNAYQDDDGCADRLGVIDLGVADTLGRVVEGADVLFGDQQDAVTGADGHVTLPDVMPRSRAVIAVRHPAYNDGVAIVDSVPDADLTVPVLLVPKPVPFELRLRGPNLEALSGSVRLVGPVKVPSVSIGDSGDETVPLVPGEWRAIVSANGYGVEERTFRVEVIDAEAAKKGDLDAGGVDLVITQVARTQVTPSEIAISGAQIRFRTGSSALEAESVPLVEEIAERLITHPEVKLIEIQGHTDNVGDDAANLKLSQDRVDAVREFLLNWGVEPSRVRTIGFGEGVPIAPNDTDEGRAKNRRVQFVIIERDTTVKPAP